MDTISKKNIAGFDLLKFVMSFFIVCLHTRIFAEFHLINRFIHPLLQIAVPCFFILSSFFFLRKCREKGFDWTNLYIYLKRLFILYFFWYVISFIFILRNIQIYLNTCYTNNYLDILHLLYVSTTFQGSWFISSMMIAVALFFCLKKLRCPDYIQFIISFFMYVYVYYVNFLPTELHIFDWLYFIKSDLRLTFLVAYIWIFIGYCLSNPCFITLVDKIKEYFSILFIIILLLFIWLIVINIPLSVEPVFRLFEAPVFIIAFYLFKFPSNTIWIHLRNYSILIYFLHFIIHNIYVHFRFMNFGLSRFLFVYSISFIIATIILILEKNKYFHFLKYSH